MGLHPDTKAISFLLGAWGGEGVGVYPTIDDFSYGEEIVFTAPPGKPFVHYAQRTWRTGDHPESGTPLHTESGYLRPIGEGRIEALFAQPTGIVDIHSGTVEGTEIRLKSDVVALTGTAKRVDSVERTLLVDGDRLDYELWMGAVDQEHQLHLKAVLNRVL